jgi:hypothetical protein
MEKDMPQAEMQREANSAAEPLLPIEKKLIGWSLAAGIAGLTILLLLSRL